MSDVTQLLNAIEQGDPQATDRLLPLVYQELRQLASAQMTREKPGQTLDATALVHEAYLRLVRKPQNQEGPAWSNRRHFVAAAAEAMRRILVEIARAKKRQKRGGAVQHIELGDEHLARNSGSTPEDLLVLDEALDRLANEDPSAAEVVQLHVFAGASIEETGETLGISRATAYRHWTFARAWLRCELAEHGEPGE
jgi:RNA polymerase sigma factor (TIGR02999 family)